MKRFYIIYKGRVQGVGFRSKLYSLALQYGITGYARNCANGTVECEFQGEKTEEFLKGSLSGDYFVRIDDYVIKQLPLVEDEEGFRIRF